MNLLTYILAKEDILETIKKEFQEVVDDFVEVCGRRDFEFVPAEETC